MHPNSLIFISTLFQTQTHYMFFALAQWPDMCFGCRPDRRRPRIKHMKNIKQHVSVLCILTDEIIINIQCWAHIKAPATVTASKWNKCE